MKVAIMQPYFLPYIGYFQLMKCVDQFVVYDNIQFTKKGWIHRNRFLQNGKDELFSLTILKDSDFLNIGERRLASDFLEANRKTLRKIEAGYRKAPYFKEIYPEIEKCFLFGEPMNLFDFVLNSIMTVKEYLKIDTPILISSKIDDKNGNYIGCDRIKYLCNKLGSKHYINPIGGLQLYQKQDFDVSNIKLNFLKSDIVEYKQFENVFVPSLSIMDVLMFNSLEEISIMLNQYELL